LCNKNTGLCVACRSNQLQVQRGPPKNFEFFIGISFPQLLLLETMEKLSASPKQKAQKRVTRAAKSKKLSTSQKIPPKIDRETVEGKLPDERISLLDLLRSPKRSELERKRSVKGGVKIQLQAHKSERKSTSAKKHNLVNLNPKQRLAEAQFKNEPFKDIPGVCSHVFCLACKEEVNIKKDRITDHVNSSKHDKAKQKFAQQLEKGLQTETVLEALQKGALKGPDGEAVVIPPGFGSNVGATEATFRLDLLRAFMTACIPLNILPYFDEFLSKWTRRCPDPSTMRKAIPILQASELEELKCLLKTKPFSVCFDGTTRVCEAFAVVVRFLDENLLPVQKLVTISMIADQLDGEATAREVAKIIMRRLDVADEHSVVGFMRDGVGVNSVAVRQLQFFYPVAEDLTCCSHTLDRVGFHFRYPTLDRFWGSWVQLFSHSRRAKAIFKDIVGVGWIDYSPTRWWSKFECFQQLSAVFPDLLRIVSLICEASCVEASSAINVKQMLTDFRTLTELKVELAAVCDAATPFVKATYNLEGDGLLAFVAYEELLKCKRFVDDPHLPNLRAICLELGGTADPPTPEFNRLFNLGLSCMEPGFNYFRAKFWGIDDDNTPAELASQMGIFKAARYLVPNKAKELGFNLAKLEDLSAFKCVMRGNINVQDLGGEMAAYSAAFDDVAPEVDLCTFWKSREQTLPFFFALFCRVCLMQPSSASCERVFSILTHFFDGQREHALQDYVETCIMLRYNHRNQHIIEIH
jgi:hAT family C-terminal dimerisation region